VLSISACGGKAGSIDIDGALLARSGSSRGAKIVAQSARVCLTELVGRGNSEAIASRSLFAFDL
jgi:hypothetical protein